MFLSKRGNGVYTLYYQNEKGKRTSISCKTKLKSEANTFLSEFSTKLKLRNQQKVIPITLRAFLWEYLKYSENIHSPNTTLSIISTVNKLNEYFKDKNINDITLNEFTDYIYYRLKTSSMYVANREIAYLSAMFNWGIKRKYLTSNIIRDIKKIRIPQKQPNFFTKPEFDKLISITENKDLIDLFIFTLNTGLRQMEVITLEWSQINLNNKTLILDNRNHITKSKKTRSIPLNSTAMNILLKRHFQNHSNLVFTYTGQPIKQLFISHKFKKLVRKANINPKLNFHSLRSTFASYLVQKGASIYNVSKLLGHSDLRVTQIYSGLTTDDLRQSVDLLN